MRIMLTAVLPNDAGSAAIRDGTLGPTIQQILGELKPEAAYFALEDGQRTAHIICNIDQPSEMVRLAEPFFFAFGAKVTIKPVMIAADLAEGGRDMERAAQMYGRPATPERTAV